MTDHRDPSLSEGCPADHEQLVEDLRRLSTPALGRLLEPLMPSVLDGSAAEGTRHAVELVGSVLAERKQRVAA